MKIKFLGIDGQPDVTTLRGVEFKKGQPVEVDCSDLQKKLLALDYFTQVKAGRPKKHDQDKP